MRSYVFITHVNCVDSALFPAGKSKLCEVSIHWWTKHSNVFKMEKKYECIIKVRISFLSFNLSFIMTVQSKSLELHCTEKKGRHWLNINCSDMIINPIELNATYQMKEKITKLDLITSFSSPFWNIWNYRVMWFKFADLPRKLVPKKCIPLK